MRLGMMQPYFFPYLGYFGLIHATDEWIVFDTPQYIRRGWVNRNRILSDGKTPWKYIRVPIAACDRDTAIRDVRIHPDRSWKRDLLNSLEVYRLLRAPFYVATISMLETALRYRHEHLSELLVHCLETCCQHIGLPLRCRRFSELQLSLPRIGTPGEWALETARALGAHTYINPPGGRTLFNPSAFHSARVSLRFLTPQLPEYYQGGLPFQPGLSIIDALMWNDVSTVRHMIAQYVLESDAVSQAA